MLRSVSYLAVVAGSALAACADAVTPPATPPDPLGSPNFASVAEVARFPVTFNLPGGTCGLTTTVTGTGSLQSVSRISQIGAGEVRIAFSETAHGTATGADGSQYRFNYSANYEVTEVLDPSGLPVVIDLVDTFTLLGQGQAPDIKVFLHGQFLFDGTLPLTPIGDPVIRGGIACDPL